MLAAGGPFFLFLYSLEEPAGLFMAQNREKAGGEQQALLFETERTERKAGEQEALSFPSTGGGQEAAR